jgi:hypothetical protein
MFLLRDHDALRRGRVIFAHERILAGRESAYADLSLPMTANDFLDF